jgi:hypothetical protein
MTCPGTTKLGDGCKIRRNCRWHSVSCPICIEHITDAYKLDCTHNFHEHCISSWFSVSEGCPICRTVNETDKYVIFKRSVEESVSNRYADAIRTLEDEVASLKRRIRHNNNISRH